MISLQKKSILNHSMYKNKKAIPWGEACTEYSPKLRLSSHSHKLLYQVLVSSQSVLLRLGSAQGQTCCKWSGHLSWWYVDVESCPSLPSTGQRSVGPDRNSWPWPVAWVWVWCFSIISSRGEIDRQLWRSLVHRQLTSVRLRIRDHHTKTDLLQI